jgi:hypothetical protein
MYYAIEIEFIQTTPRRYSIIQIVSKPECMGGYVEQIRGKIFTTPA